MNRSGSLKITWYTDDGYVGHRPHEITINPHDYEGMERDEIESALNELIQDDFEQTVTWRCSKLDDYIIQIITALENSNDD